MRNRAGIGGGCVRKDSKINNGYIDGQVDSETTATALVFAQCGGEEERVKRRRVICMQRTGSRQVSTSGKNYVCTKITLDHLTVDTNAPKFSYFHKESSFEMLQSMLNECH